MVRTKAQSALEYLLTYGWAILIIGIALIALFALGVFTSGGFTGTSCVFQSGLVCDAPPVLSHTTGNLTITLGQASGYNLNDLYVACATTSNSTGLPYAVNGKGFTFSPFESVNATNYAAQFSQTNEGANVTNGQIITITNIQCYNSAGTALTSATAVGTVFSGHIWLAYNGPNIHAAAYAGPPARLQFGPVMPGPLKGAAVGLDAVNQYVEIGSITVKAS